MISNEVIIQSFRGSDCPLYIDGDGVLCYTSQCGQSTNRVFVASSPKAGTYLLDRLLTKLGAVSVEMHFSPDGLDDFRRTIVRSRTEQYLRRRVKVPFTTAVSLIRPGQFGVGHIPHQPVTAAAVRDFSVVFTKRELRAILISHMRMVQAPGRFNWLAEGWKTLPDGQPRMAGYMRVVGPSIIKLQRDMVGWIDRPGVSAISFETLLGDYGEEARIQAVSELGRACGLDLNRAEVLAALQDSVGKPTRTFSGERSSLDRYWDAACESQFVALGGPALNEKLGYA